MDSPKIHEFIFNFIIKPLVEKKMMKFDNLKWHYKSVTNEDEEEDPDEMMFNETNAQFKFVALIMMKEK